MANTKVTGDLIANSTIATGNIADNAVTSDKISGITTAHITEGSNLYYTDTRARGAISVSGNALSYNSSTGVITSNFEESPSFTGIITANSSSSGDYVRLYGASGTGKWDIYGNGANLRISDNESAGILAVDTGAIFGGNVGIGTTSPTSRLSISGLQAAIDITRGNSGDSKWEFSSDSTGLYFSEMSTGTRAYMMTIKETTGNVGIGTTSPERVLHLDANQGRAIIQLDKGGDKIISMGTGSSATNADDTIFQMFNEGAELVRIFTEGNSWLNGGNVGIGTTSPGANLEISGIGGDGAPLLRFTGSASATFNWISSAMHSNLAAGETSIHLFGQAESSKNSGYIGYLYSGAGSDGNAVTIGHYASNHLVNVLANGNVGIGTTSPSATKPTGSLIATGWGVSDNKALEISAPNSASNGANSGLFLRNSNNSTGTDITSDNYYGNTFIDNRFDNDVGDIYFRTRTAGTPQTRMIIEGGGNVGIGTTSPNAGLEIKTLSGGSGVNTLRLNTSFANGNTVDINPFITGLNNGGMEIKLVGSQKLVMLPSGDVGIGTASPTRKLDVAGEITHEGLVPKNLGAGDVAFIDGLVTINKTVSITANTWTSLDISLSNIGGTGTFAVQVYSNAHGSTGAAWYNMYWSGIMSWFHSSTNDDDIDEIPLHMAGHARNNNTLELRTKLHTADGSSYANRCELQIKTANTISSAAISFRFRKLL